MIIYQKTMGFNGFTCDGCGELVDFAGDGEAAVCVACSQFDLGDGCCYCLSCGEKKQWLTCEECGEYLCPTCYQESHTCPDCQEEDEDEEDVEDEGITFPPGEYYIGDPCYIVSDEMWDQWCYQYKMKEGAVVMDDIKWAVHHTHCGDGEFKGTDGFVYHVDSGCLGMVPSFLFDPTKRQHAEKLGTFHKFETEMQFHVFKHEKETHFVIWDNSDDELFELEIYTW
jgi:hypothetical protein